jgi:hypothetical protein
MSLYFLIFLICSQQLQLSSSALLGMHICGAMLEKDIKNPQEFLLIISCVESDFGQNTDGKDGEIGIMQIHPYWFKKYNWHKELLAEDFENICFSAWLFKQLFSKYKNLDTVLQVYNTGSIKKRNKKYLERYEQCEKRVQQIPIKK